MILFISWTFLCYQKKTLLELFFYLYLEKNPFDNLFLFILQTVIFQNIIFLMSICNVLVKSSITEWTFSYYKINCFWLSKKRQKLKNLKEPTGHTSNTYGFTSSRILHCFYELNHKLKQLNVDWCHKFIGFFSHQQYYSLGFMLCFFCLPEMTWFLNTHTSVFVCPKRAWGWRYMDIWGLLISSLLITVDIDR